MLLKGTSPPTSVAVACYKNIRLVDARISSSFVQFKKCIKAIFMKRVIS